MNEYCGKGFDARLPLFRRVCKRSNNKSRERFAPCFFAWIGSLFLDLNEYREQYNNYYDNHRKAPFWLFEQEVKKKYAQRNYDKQK